MNNNIVTKDHIEQMFWKSTKKLVTLFDKTTVLAVQLENGFVIVESSSCVDPANYNENVGFEACMEKVMNKLWLLEGYKLQLQMGTIETETPEEIIKPEVVTEDEEEKYNEMVAAE